MKRYIISIFLLLPFLSFAQIPAGYYTSATGLNGQSLRVALRNIIRPHTVLSYTPGLWNAYATTDVKPNGKLWDIYSDVPGGTPLYEYVIGASSSGGNQCGSVSPSAEGSCYNREHTWPQSKFASDTPMQSDLFIVYPTDYYVNGQRGDLPYGIAGTVSHTFSNGSKIGTNNFPGAPTGNCYEPVDAYKGDLARTYFYVATCYWGADSVNFTSWETATGLTFNPWAIQMLLQWHHNDPVSQKEMDRNNAAYSLQHNRNPFIDHPEYADCIWGGCSDGVTDVRNDLKGVFVAALQGSNILNVNWSNVSNDVVTGVSVLNMSGQLVFHSGTTNTSELTVSTGDWAKGVYVVRIQSLRTVVSQKVVLQ